MSVIDKIRENFSQFTFLYPGDIIDLASITKIKQLQKGEHLVRVGDYNYSAVKVLKGLLCHYIIDADGVQKALIFVPEKMNTGSLETALNMKPADENIIALENTLILCTEMRDLNKLASENIRILKLLNQGYKQIISSTAERIKFLIIHTPEERYIHFVNSFPDLEQRVKQKDLASYLGITVTSLSRIRSRISKSLKLKEDLKLP
ncbi:MAG: Crp/Fnr family transcriptional regulator [Saprospiraceae bacterium]|jgi:CRP-like cAMP-binding protein|nr:Crp/Fnr family transcriptional regulator [Saprospiraceae bacterium]MBL0023959.1 Crp/Fnr family transcriptional regulator [Saprospiraceae bacterium]